MPIEFRILTGARAGQSARFEQAVVVVGRHGASDLRFDPQQDLDVSGRHAEIRLADGHYTVHDIGSTNGTYVNGKRVEPGTGVELADGDKVTFGAKGPEAEVRVWLGEASPPPRTTAKRAAISGGANTEQRIAFAVSKQTAGLKRALYAGLGAIVLAAGGFVYYNRMESAREVEALRQQILDNERMRVMLQSSMGASGDTALVNQLKRDLDALQRRLPAATSDAERDQIKSAIQENEARLRRMVQMDLPTIHAKNAPAVVLLISDIAGQNSAGTGFSVSSDGLIITNRHNVKHPQTGQLARRIAIKFTDTRDWLPAEIVKVSENPDEDLAVIRVSRPEAGPFPVVAGVTSATTAGDASEGMSVVIIGYPLGYDTPMEGEGNDFIAKSTLNAGTVSKRTSSVLQIDSYATHGSSGSPVFSTQGFVVGVVFGGQRDANGRIVYAVPPERIAAFIPDAAAGILRK